MATNKNKDGLMVALTAAVIDAALKSGLNWEEAVAAFGRSAKALAQISAMMSDGDLDKSVTAAGRAFHEGLASDVVVDVGEKGPLH